MCTGGWFGGFLKTDYAPDASGKWGVAKMPGGVKASNWGGSFLVIPEQSKNKAAAWAFVKYMLATKEGQNDIFQAVDYFPAYTPAYEDTEIYDATDDYFSVSSRKTVAELAKELEPVNTTMMDTTAEGCIYSSVNAGLEQGLDAEGIRDLVNQILKSDSRGKRTADSDLEGCRCLGQISESVQLKISYRPLYRNRPVGG